jgi:uncharacterized protein (TIGR03437 family)
MRAFVFLFVVCSAQAFPLWFEPNRGQAHPSVQFVSRDASLDSTRVAIHIGSKPVVMSLIGARPAHGDGLDPQAGITSYFLGNDPKKWHAGIPHYARVQYKDIYPGIDLIYYHNADGLLEYDFMLSPGADPERIEIAWNQPMHEDKNGDLLVAGVRQKRPKVYQNGREIAAVYRIHSSNHVRLSLASYDRSQTLTVDPVLQYSTYLGGPALEWGSGIQVDSTGSAYLTGSTRSPASPSLNPFQQVASLSEDVYVLKLTPSGNSVAFFVVLGGAGDDYSEGITLDGMNNAWIAGMTRSLDFPAKNAAQPIYGGGFDDGFYAKVSADGRSILVSSYVGGISDDWARAVAVGPDGSGWVVGYTNSFDFPTKNPIKATLTGAPDVFLLNVSSDGKLMFATFFGGTSREFGDTVATDNQGNVYIAGGTESDDFPVKNALQPIRNALPTHSKAFLSKFSPTGSLLYSTFLGGSAECSVIRLAVGSLGDVHVLGWAQGGFPVKNAVQAIFNGTVQDKFVMKLAPDGQSVIFATYLGGSGPEYGYGGLAVDRAGNVYVAGHTISADFPTKNPVQQFTARGTPSSGNATIVEFAPDGGLMFSTFFGGTGDEWADGIALDSAGSIYITGTTRSTDYPTKNAIQTAYGGGGGDILVAKFAPDTLPASQFAASPIVLPFRYVIGGSVPPSQTVRITSTAPGLTFMPSSASSWLKVMSSSTTTPAMLTVSVDPAGLSPGPYSGKIQIDPQTSVQVNLTVLAPAPTVMGVAPQSVPVGADTTIVMVTGSGFQQGAVVQVNGVAFPTTFIDSGTLQFPLDKSSLKQQATLAITVMNPQSAPSSPLTLTIGTPAPQLTAASITNAANFTSGPVAPGEIISIFGMNLTGDVTFDGTPATLVFASPTQVNVTVPYSVAAPITVLQMGASSVQLQVAPSAPGIFAAVSAGDNIVVLYATGCGALTNDDLPRCALAVSVTVNDQLAIVLYAGVAPGLVQGANQINIQLPDGITFGRLTIVLTAGDASSKPFSFTMP